MKIGILTFHFSDNYGALLQAYALRRWLMICGYQAEFINYQPDYVEAGGEFRNIFNPYRFKSNLKTAYLRFTHFRAKYFGSKVARMAMDAFRLQKLGVEGPVFKNSKTLCENLPDYDVIICGSDQIWNPSDQYGVDPVYFLDFPSNCRRKISYAASFGSSEVLPAYHKQIKALLFKLDGISVREEKSVTFVKNLIGKECICVPDPTFLLNSYSELLENVSSNSDDHIFSYVLRSGEGFMEIADALKNKLHAKVLSAYNPHRRWRDVGEKLNGGVLEWLTNLFSSRIVITNSFHATAFSILLNRPFISVSLPGAKAKFSGRIENLLSKTGLMERLIPAGDVNGALRLAVTPIDWKKVNTASEDLRTIGRNYLAEQIQAIN